MKVIVAIEVNNNNFLSSKIFVISFIIFHFEKKSNNQKTIVQITNSMKINVLTSNFSNIFSATEYSSHQTIAAKKAYSIDIKK